MRPSRALSSIAIALALGLASCARDPLERAVSVATPSKFAAWRAHIGSDAGVEMRRRMDEALQEIRLKVSGDREIKRAMGETVTGGTEEIDESVRQRVDGRLLREVLQYGYELRVRRLNTELAGLEDAMSKNAQLVTKPGDYQSKQHLEGLRDRQMGRVEKYRAEIAAAERELEPLVAKTGRRLLEAQTEPLKEMVMQVKR